jgi:hypothetical protein
MLGAIWRASHHLHPHTKINLYYAHIHSHLSYMAHIWGASDSTYLRTLRVLQNKAIRAIFRSEYVLGTSTAHLYKIHNILPVDKLTTFSAAVATFKLLNPNSNANIQLVTNREVHHYSTRRRSQIHLTQPHNRWGLAAITYRGANSRSTTQTDFGEL